MEGQGPLTEEMFHSLLQLAVKRQASDVHFEVGYPPTYRVFGELLAAKYPPLTEADTEAIAGFVRGEAQEIEAVAREYAAHSPFRADDDSETES